MARVQATLLLYLFFFFNLARSRPLSFTIDQSDSNLVKFSGNWNTTSYSSAIGGSYAFASERAARVSIALPLGTVAAHYLGFRPQMSANYSFCVDCVTNGITNDFVNATSVQINGTLLNTGERATPRLLFTVGKLDPRVSHSLIVFNPTPQNVITIDAVVVNVTNDTATMPSGVYPAPTPASTSFSMSSHPSRTSTPMSSLLSVSVIPSSTGYSVTSTLPSPSATSEDSGFGGIGKNGSLALIISLTIASAIILAVIFIIHRHVRRPRWDNPVLEPDGSSSAEVRPRVQSIGAVHDNSGGTESNVLPGSPFWRALSPNTGSLFGRLGAIQLNSRHATTPSMMETLRSCADSSGSVSGSDGGERSRPPKSMV